MKKFIFALALVSATSAFAVPQEDAAIKKLKAEVEQQVQALRLSKSMTDAEKHQFVFEQRSWEVQINNACATDKECVLASYNNRVKYLKLVKR